MAVLTQQRSLIHGLPDHLVADEILPRATSWWDCRSIRAVSKGWRGAMEHERAPKRMMAAIHRIPPISSELPLESMEFAVSVYDPELGSWERLPPIPGIPGGVPMSARCICVDGKLFVLGGRVLRTLEYSAGVFAMDLRACKRRWIRCACMREARAGFACMAWKGTIVVAGGQGDDDRLAMDSVEAYSIDRDCWMDLPELEIPRADCTGAVIENGILCVVGGFTILPCDHGDQQVWMDSMEVLKTGKREDFRWEIVDSSSSHEDVLGSCVITSGVLYRAPPHSLAVERTLNRCRRRRRGSGDDRGDDSSPDRSEEEDDHEELLGLDLVMMGIGEGSEEYVTRYRHDVAGGAETRLCLCRRAKIGNKNDRIWEEIGMPFELLPTVACCSVSL